MFLAGSLVILYSNISKRFERAEKYKDYTVTEGTVENIETHRYHKRHRTRVTYSVTVRFIRKGREYTYTTHSIENYIK